MNQVLFDQDFIMPLVNAQTDVRAYYSVNADRSAFPLGAARRRSTGQSGPDAHGRWGWTWGNAPVLCNGFTRNCTLRLTPQDTDSLGYFGKISIQVTVTVQRQHRTAENAGDSDSHLHLSTATKFNAEWFAPAKSFREGVGVKLVRLRFPRSADPFPEVFSSHYAFGNSFKRIWTSDGTIKIGQLDSA